MTLCRFCGSCPFPRAEDWHRPKRMTVSLAPCRGGHRRARLSSFSLRITIQKILRENVWLENLEVQENMG